MVATKHDSRVVTRMPNFTRVASSSTDETLLIAGKPSCCSNSARQTPRMHHLSSPTGPGKSQSLLLMTDVHRDRSWASSALRRARRCCVTREPRPGWEVDSSGPSKKRFQIAGVNCALHAVLSDTARSARSSLGKRGHPQRVICGRRCRPVTSIRAETGRGPGRTSGRCREGGRS